MSFRGNSADSGQLPLAASDTLSTERIEAACRSAAEGKLAARTIAAWLDGLDISEPEFRLLWLLAGAVDPSLTAASLDQAELAERLVVSPAQVSGAVERLRHMGLLERAANQGDRRRQLWRITAAGDALLRRIVNQVAAATSQREVAA